MIGAGVSRMAWRMSVLAAGGLWGAAFAAELDGKAIMERVAEIDGGEDATAKISFEFRGQQGDGPERLTYTMLWKDYQGEDGLESKVVFFTEYPPDDRGKAFMSYRYTAASGKQNEHWLYLPQLRMVRKMTHHDHDHEDDPFAHSDLTEWDMVPRPVAADRHRRLDDDQIQDRSFYVVESVPREPPEDYPYRKRKLWVSQENFLPTRIDYFESGERPSKRQLIRWQQVGDAWLWDKVMATDLTTGHKTVLTLSELEVNQGIDDRMFSERTLKRGVSALR